MMRKHIIMPKEQTWYMAQQKKKGNALNTFLKCFQISETVTMWCRIGWVKDCGIEKVRRILSPLSLGNCVGGLEISVYSFPHSLFQSQQALAIEYTLAFLGCLSWFFSSYFFYPPPLSPVVTCTFPPPTSPHSTPHPHSPFLSSAIVLWWRQVQQEVHLHLYHTCNVLSAGLNTTVSTWHFGNACLSSQALIPRLISHETWVE